MVREIGILKGEKLKRRSAFKLGLFSLFLSLTTFLPFRKKSQAADRNDYYLSFVIVEWFKEADILP